MESEITENTEMEEEYLPFARAEVIRLMKENLDEGKMIRERVKVEMNKFLGEVLVKVCEQLNEYPYTTIEYEMLKESIYPYQNIERIKKRKRESWYIYILLKLTVTLYPWTLKRHYGLRTFLTMRSSPY